MKRKKDASKLGNPNKKLRSQAAVTCVDIYEEHDQQSETGIPNLKESKPAHGKNNKFATPKKKLAGERAQTINMAGSNTNFNNAQLSHDKSMSRNTSSTDSTQTKALEMKDHREWEQIDRPRTVRGGLIFGMLNVLHAAQTYYFRDIQSAPGYLLLGCISFGMAMYAKYARTKRAFQRMLGIILIMFAATRLIAIAFFIDCSHNFIGSTCTQLRQRKYPMRWAFDSVACLTLASYLPCSRFRLLAAMEIAWVLLAIYQMQPKHLAEQGIVGEVTFGLLLLFLCTDAKLRSNERMRKQIECRERTDRIVNHRTYSAMAKCLLSQVQCCALARPWFPSNHHNKSRSFAGIKNILADTYSTLLLYPQGLANLQDLARSATSVQRASRSIQNSLNLSQLLNPEVHDINPKAAQSNSREVKLGGWIREHGPSHALMHIVAHGCDVGDNFVIQEILAAGQRARSHTHLRSHDLVLFFLFLLVCFHSFLHFFYRTFPGLGS